MTMQRATSIAISAVSAAPLRGTIATFEIDEELAHRLCCDLERFLTQVPRRTSTARSG